MNMTTKIHIDTISVQQRLQTFTHIGTFTFLFRRIGIDRMMADYDLPFLSRRGKRFFNPLKLLFHILSAGIGIFLRIFTVFVNQRRSIYKYQQGFLIFTGLHDFWVITGRDDPTTAFLAVIQYRLRITAILMVPVDGKPLQHQLRMAVNKLVVCHPQRIVDAGYSLEMMSIPGRDNKFDVYLFRQVSHQLGNRLLFIITVPSQVADQIKIFAFFRYGRNVECLPC